MVFSQYQDFLLKKSVLSYTFHWILISLCGIVLVQNAKGETHMKTQKFGIEIELTGITRKDAAKVIAKFYGTREIYEGGVYKFYSVPTNDGRCFKVMRDASIQPEMKDGSTATDDYKTEIVSPICTYSDIEDIQEIVRQLRHKGAIANSSCGIHVHINAAPHNARSIRNIVNIMTSKEDILFKAIGVSQARAERWCKKNEMTFVNKLNKAKPQSTDTIGHLWYNGNMGRRYDHYDSSRYHALNLHAVWQKGTIEFRCFNGTTHAGKIKTYIQLCLAISHQALTQKASSPRKTATTNEKYTFRTWLLRLGLIGDEFKTARNFLLENLDGDIAFRNGRPEPQMA